MHLSNNTALGSRTGWLAGERGEVCLPLAAVGSDFVVNDDENDDENDENILNYRRRD